MVKARLRHARKIEYCRDGMILFAERYGFSLWDFARNGIDVEELEATGHAMAIEIARIAREESENGRS